MSAPLNNDELRKFIEEKIQVFYTNRKKKIASLKLSTILAKNPYLFRAKNIGTAEQYVRTVLDALLSSGEETSFGNFLEQLAIFVCEKVHSGRKSGAKGIDLEVDIGGVRYIIAVKSGPNWGNDSQIQKMIQDFHSYRKTASTSGSRLHVEFINGCCYGRDSSPDKKSGYTKLCGQEFWEFISGDPNLYIDLIEPLGESAERPSAEMLELYDQAVNRITRDFLVTFCDDAGNINWEAIVRATSSRLVT